MYKLFCNVFVLLLFLTANLYSQKRVEKKIDGKTIGKIRIVSQNISSLTINSTETDVILINAVFHGETASNIVLTSKTEGDNLIIGTAFTPFFIPENDKLAAHKVLAGDVKMEVPKGYSVSIELENASVFVSGDYKKLQVALQRGNLELTTFKGNAFLSTIDSDIKVKALTGVRGIGESKNGKVINELEGNGSFLIKAYSRNGSISLTHN